MTDGGHDRLGGKLLFVDIQALHDPCDGFFGIIGVIDSKSGGKTDKPAMGAQDPHTDSVESPAPDILGQSLVTQLSDQTVLDLPCRLIGKGDGQDTVGGAGRVDELGQDLLDLPHRQADGLLKIAHVCFGKFIGEILVVVRVAVANEESNATDEDGGFTAACAGKHQKRSLGCENSFSLHFVEGGIDLIKQGSFGVYVAG